MDGWIIENFLRILAGYFDLPHSHAPSLLFSLSSTLPLPPTHTRTYKLKMIMMMLPPTHIPGHTIRRCRIRRLVKRRQRIRSMQPKFIEMMSRSLKAIVEEIRGSARPRRGRRAEIEGVMAWVGGGVVVGVVPHAGDVLVGLGEGLRARRGFEVRCCYVCGGGAGGRVDRVEAIECGFDGGEECFGLDCRRWRRLWRDGEIVLVIRK